MDHPHGDVHALLQEIVGNGDSYEDVQHSMAPHRHISRPLYQEELSRTSSRTPPSNVTSWPISYGIEAATGVEGYAYGSCTQNDLDEYDRALLAEPTQPVYHQDPHSSSLGGMRVSLPHSTASSYSPTSPFRPNRSQLRPQRQPRKVPEPKRFNAVISKYDCPSSCLKVASSSPSNVPVSSPTIGVKRRRNSLHDSNRPDEIDVNRQHVAQFQVKRHNARHVRQREPTRRTDLAPTGAVQSSQNQPLELAHAPLTIRGIQLISLNNMPDRFRSVFPFPLFNAIQSKCYLTAYQSSDNLVVSAPTGGGKTAILEMAICRLVATLDSNQYKIVYMAPTKSLCSERQRDWQGKFATLGLQCAELTGDTDHAHLRNVQSADIVVTTPEKWDSMTRKWKDHARLMQMVKLLLIDEVHILKDVRGATLEAVISRMKSVASKVRFVALSATVPNSEDVAAWLGQNSANSQVQAVRETFGEEFRPVKLQKHVVGLPYRGSDFGFERACDPLLPGIIAKYSHRKPIMIFCITRKSTVTTAKLLANLWAAKPAVDRCWTGPTSSTRMDDPDLRSTLSAGVAFHHAGLSSQDRLTVEKGFLEGQINVICCTSTLAVGVNLPCHFVIIKNTVSYQDDGIQEYSDLEIMQMLGRAGRPQFDDTAVAVIITKQEKVTKYEKLVSGEDLLESCLHLNLIDHLNAEIELGTISTLDSAKRWLAGTFLFVRLGKNPAHYKIENDAKNLSLDERVEQICKRDLALLQDHDLVSSDAHARLKTTEFGSAMARYYVRFESMRILLGLGRHPKMSDILSAIVEADEYSDIRMRANEKKLYKEINRHGGIKFPIKSDLTLHAHKRSLILQSELGGIEFPADEEYAKHRKQFMQDKSRLFSNVSRLIRCVIDIQIEKQDAVAVRHALELARSLSARVWDNSPFQLKQLPQIGLVAIRKLALGGITSIDALEAAEPHRIEMLLSKNPPFGSRILTSISAFPKLRVSIKMAGKDIKKGQMPIIKIRAELAFMNDKPPVMFHRRPIHVCLLTERSDGLLVDFRRMLAKTLENGVDMFVSAELTSTGQTITCHVMCDEIAGTLRHAELKPELPASVFPRPIVQTTATSSTILDPGDPGDPGRQQAETNPNRRDSTTINVDEFDDNDLDGEDWSNLETGNSISVDISRNDEFSKGKPSMNAPQELQPWEPERLENGKWACNHKCKDKKTCKHLCCHEGLDKAPKPPKNTTTSTSSAGQLPLNIKNTHFVQPHKEQRKQQPTVPMRHKAREKTEFLDLASPSRPSNTYKTSNGGSHEYECQRSKPIGGPSTSAMTAERQLLAQRGVFMGDETIAPHPAHDLSDKSSTSYSDDWAGELPSITEILHHDMHMHNDGSIIDPAVLSYAPVEKPGKEYIKVSPCQADDAIIDFDLSQNRSEAFALEEALVGLSDSVTVQRDSQLKDVAKFDLPKQQSSDKLFISTDSPEKLQWPDETQPASRSSLHTSRQIIADVEPEAVVDKHGEAQHSTRQCEEKTEPHARVIRPGQPCWVYELDPAFIAEYQDIIEFV